MSTLYIDRQGSQLKLSGGVLVVNTPDEASARRLPLKYLERVVLRTDTELSSKVLCGLAAEGVNLIALGGRRGEEIAQITGSPHNDAKRRWQQVLFLSQEAGCTQFARRIVIAKVKKQLAVLRHLSALRPDLRKPMHDGQRQIATIVEALLTDEKNNNLKLEQIRGMEGAGAAAYFGAYFTAFAPKLGATGRNRRPPRDPVNAVLSLSYTMLYSRATEACWAAGLDPAIGALHSMSHGRAALACDLMEPLRPAVDSWVWQLFRDGHLRAEHFGLDGAGHCLLGKAGRSSYYPLWEEQQKRLGKILQKYAKLASSAFVTADTPSHWSALTDHEGG
ncbi:MAG: CRISPR-associated endonuclease Cas1 [Serpentinimonas sp.]|nr:MAG: hypothetical protein JM57_09835 [Comamonadaceae bacterium BICA1-1]MDO8274755.1 CRISPR-associated endonuclease Cas1 [Serpentinimonas sp.]MDO9611081.1 CRISPR-associated endonuclease Cas1 [Serpentinimonas sp.]